MCEDKVKDWLAGSGIDDREAVEGWWERAEKLPFTKVSTDSMQRYWKSGTPVSADNLAELLLSINWE